jgi:hypothetical protein
MIKYMCVPLNEACIIIFPLHRVYTSTYNLNITTFLLGGTRAYPKVSGLRR